MSMQENGIFAAFYFGPGQPISVGLHPDDGFHTERLRSLSFDFVDDESVPYIVTSAIYEGDPGHGPTMVDHITYSDGLDDEEVALTRGLKGVRRFFGADAADAIPICDGYALGDFGRAALAYVNGALGGVPGPQAREDD